MTERPRTKAAVSLASRRNSSTTGAPPKSHTKPWLTVDSTPATRPATINFCHAISVLYRTSLACPLFTNEVPRPFGAIEHKERGLDAPGCAGALHALFAKGTHLGCVVHWNSAEQSWDCPCHSYRFAFSGEVLHGPAAKALERAGVQGTGSADR